MLLLTQLSLKKGREQATLLFIIKSYYF